MSIKSCKYVNKDHHFSLVCYAMLFCAAGYVRHQCAARVFELLCNCMCAVAVFFGQSAVELFPFPFPGAWMLEMLTGECNNDDAELATCVGLKL